MTKLLTKRLKISFKNTFNGMSKSSPLLFRVIVLSLNINDPPVSFLMLLRNSTCDSILINNIDKKENKKMRNCRVSVE